MLDSVLLIMIAEDSTSETWLSMFQQNIVERRKKHMYFIKNRETYFRMPCNYNDWLQRYNEVQFYRLFRLQKETFNNLLNAIMKRDTLKIVTKKYHGGNVPVEPNKALLVFLYYMATQDTLNSIGDRFNIVPSTVMNIINVFLYITLQLKNKYIFWPKLQELEYVATGFKRYPGVIGAVDGTHIDIKVPSTQHDSYADRYLKHSINLMAVCTAQRVFTYIYVGFPGSAHDSRVFDNSILAKEIEQYGANKYFGDIDKYHLLGDAAFPLRRWLMKPFRQHANMSRMEKNHNYRLGADRVAIENTFGILKGRWRRLHFINTYNVAKSIEIATAACVLHNFCILSMDEWTGEVEEVEDIDEDEYREGNFLEQQLGQQKRQRIAEEFMRN